MVSGLETRGAAIARAARDRAVARLAERVRDAAPDLRVTVEGEGVTVNGRGVLSDPRLMWIGSLLR